MIRVQTDEGIIEIEEQELLAARTSIQFDKYTKTLQLIIRWTDSGIVGQPMIEEIDGFYSVSIRKAPKKDNSVLARANRLRDKIFGK